MNGAMNDLSNLCYFLGIACVVLGLAKVAVRVHYLIERKLRGLEGEGED